MAMQVTALLTASDLGSPGPNSKSVFSSVLVFTLVEKNAYGHLITAKQ
jgi:hypothetical protein